MGLETLTVCPVCDGNHFEPFLTAVDHTATGEQFKLTRCPSCDLVITNPRPTQSTIGKYYQSDRYISHTGGGTSALDRIYRAVRRYSINRKLALIKQHHPTGSLLDYGAGTGEFLLAAQQQGWTSIGIEPSDDARQKQDPTLTVHSSLETVNATFDVITMWHVLEHVHDLNSTLSKLKAMLKPGGTIIIAVPNRGSHDARSYREHWAGYDVPRHLWHFTKTSMHRLLSRHQLKVAQVLPLRFDAYYVSLLSESYKRPGNKLANMLAGFLTGLRSNLSAGPDNYSSLIYIAGA